MLDRAAPASSGPAPPVRGRFVSSESGPNDPSAEAWDDPPAEAWAYDAEALRDEGVLFGLAGDEAGLARKRDLVVAEAEARLAALERRRAGLLAERDHVRARRAALDDRLAALRRRLDDPAALVPPVPEGDAPDAAPHFVLHYAVGLVLAVGLCVLNYALIVEMVAPAFGQPALVAAGILMAGMFAFFQPSPLRHGNDRDQGKVYDAPAELWKQRISEFGVPFAAALFTVVWRLEAVGPVKSAVSFLFIFMLFLFGGTLVLSTLPKLSLSARTLLRARRVRRAQAEVQATLDRLESEAVPALDAEARAALRSLAACPAAREVEAARDRLVALLDSEFALARAVQSRPPDAARAAAADAPVLGRSRG
jgi:hypothetical protein